MLLGLIPSVEGRDGVLIKAELNCIRDMKELSIAIMINEMVT